MEEMGMLVEMGNVEVPRKVVKSKSPTPSSCATETETKLDPILVIGAIAELWMPDGAFTHSTCACVSKGWKAAVAHMRSRQGAVVTISAFEPRCGADGALRPTEDRVVIKVLSAVTPNLAEIRLHGLELISDLSLAPLVQAGRTLRLLRVVGLTFCTRLTTHVTRYMPPSVRELRVAGCRAMYSKIEELERNYTLDIHKCPKGVQLVEEQAYAGFRFVDAAWRSGIRMGAWHMCRCKRRTTEEEERAQGDSNECKEDCESIPDVHGVARRGPPDVWHASSFDWGGYAEQRVLEVLEGVSVR